MAHLNEENILMKASKLIYPSSGWWKVPLIGLMFGQHI